MDAISRVEVPQTMLPVCLKDRIGAGDAEEIEPLRYLERSPIEFDCYRVISQPGALIRIKGSRQLGKTSLIHQILHRARQDGYQTAYLTLRAADDDVLQCVDSLLQWFCLQTGNSLQLPDQLGDYWDDLFGSSISCKSYFEEYLLAQRDQPLVLAIDDVDRLFPWPHLGDDFFGLLRAWHEEAKTRVLWQKLRIVVAHAAEVYIPLNINKSPFNVGLPVELHPFSPHQVQELAQRYGVDCSAAAESFVALLGGLPNLVQIALNHLSCRQISLEQFIQEAHGPESIYQDHLQQLWQQIQAQPDLVQALAQVVAAATSPNVASLTLDPALALDLHRLGLVWLNVHPVRFSCDLYAQFFGDRLSELSPLL